MSLPRFRLVGSGIHTWSEDNRGGRSSILVPPGLTPSVLETREIHRDQNGVGRVDGDGTHRNVETGLGSGTGTCGRLSRVCLVRLHYDRCRDRRVPLSFTEGLV